MSTPFLAIIESGAHRKKKVARKGEKSVWEGYKKNICESTKTKILCPFQRNLQSKLQVYYMSTKTKFNLI